MKKGRPLKYSQKIMRFAVNEIVNKTPVRKISELIKERFSILIHYKTIWWWKYQSIDNDFKKINSQVKREYLELNKLKKEVKLKKVNLLRLRKQRNKARFEQNEN